MYKLTLLSLTLLSTLASVLPSAHALDVSAGRLERSYPPVIAKRNELLVYSLRPSAILLRAPDPLHEMLNSFSRLY